jgi:hypothetical protein
MMGLDTFPDVESRWYSHWSQVETLEGAMNSTAAGLGLATHHILGALIEALMDKGLLSVAETRGLLKVAGQMVIDGTDTPERDEAARVIGRLIKAYPPEGH